MPVHPASYFTKAEFAEAELVNDLPFANGYPVLKLNALNNARRPPMQGGALADANNVLYDLQSDPTQSRPASEAPQHYIKALEHALTENNAPQELLRRFGFAP